MGTNTQVRQPRRGLTFDDVWAMFQETDKKFQETDKKFQETDKKFQETDKKFQEAERIIKENAAQMKAMSQETEKKIQEMVEEGKKTELLVKELSKNVGGVNGALGDMAEGLMASDLYETFEALGLVFDHSFQNYEVKERKTKRILTEVDLLLINGKIALAVEVKTTMTRGDVDKHEIRMDILRHEPNSLFANRTLYGAIAGVKMSPKALQYARDKGFFVIELTGDTIKVESPEGWTPRTW